MTIGQAVKSYFFNSQIVTLPSGKMALVLPKECRGGKTEALVREIIAQDNPIGQSYFVDLEESMKNGGGPACLRLRVVLTDREARSVTEGFILSNHRLKAITQWVNKRYRDTLNIRDLADYQLFKESCQALDELTRLLGLGAIYSFQK